MSQQPSERGALSSPTRARECYQFSVRIGALPTDSRTEARVEMRRTQRIKYYPCAVLRATLVGSGPWGGLKRPTKRPPALPGHFGRLHEDEHFTRTDPVSRKRAGITPRDPAQQFELGGRTPRYERISVDFIEQRHKEDETSDDL